MISSDFLIGIITTIVTFMLSKGLKISYNKLYNLYSRLSNALECIENLPRSRSNYDNWNDKLCWNDKLGNLEDRLEDKLEDKLIFNEEYENQSKPYFIRESISTDKLFKEKLSDRLAKNKSYIGNSVEPASYKITDYPCFKPIVKISKRHDEKLYENMDPAYAEDKDVVLNRYKSKMEEYNTDCIVCGKTDFFNKEIPAESGHYESINDENKYKTEIGRNMDLSCSYTLTKSGESLDPLRNNID